MSTAYTPRAYQHRPHLSFWMVAALVFAVALVGLGIYVLVDRNATTSEGLASPAVAAMLENRIAAMNSESGSNGQAAAEFYTTNATMEERDITPALVTRGREQIAARLATLNVAGLRIEPLGAPIQSGRFVGEAVRFYQHEGPGTGEGILVFELDTSGKIAHQWVMGVTRD